MKLFANLREWVTERDEGLTRDGIYTLGLALARVGISGKYRSICIDVSRKVPMVMARTVDVGPGLWV